MSHKSFLLAQIFNMIYFGEASEFLLLRYTNTGPNEYLDYREKHIK
jgi:hypothetical protein